MTDFWRPACWLLVVGLMIAHGSLLVRYGVDFPNVDDFSQILCVPYYFSGRPTLLEKLGYLVSLSVEHRIFTLRLAALIQAKWLGGLHFTGLMHFGGAVLLCAAGLIVFMAQRSDRAWVAVVAAALLFSPVNYEAQFWATGALQHFGVLAYGLASLFCLKDRGMARSVGAVTLALAAALTSANGLMVFPAAIGTLWLSGRAREAAIGCLLAGALFLVYFIGYDSPAAGSHFGALTHPVRLTQFFLLAVGSLAVHAIPALLLGAILVGSWVWLLLRWREIPPLLIGWICFLGLSYAAMSVGRLEFGEQAALLSRYRVYSEATVLITVVALLHVVRERSCWVIAGTVVPLALGWFAASWQNLVPVIAHGFIAQQSSRDHYLATGHAIFDQWPPQDYGDFMLSQGRALGYFEPASMESTHLVQASSPTPVVSSPMRVERLILGPRTVTITGYAPQGQAHARLWLDDGINQYQASLHVLPGVDTPIGRDWEFFWGTVSVPDASAQRYRIGYGVDNENNEQRVYWTAELLDVD